MDYPWGDLGWPCCVPSRWGHSLGQQATKEQLWSCCHPWPWWLRLACPAMCRLSIRRKTGMSYLQSPSYLWARPCDLLEGTTTYHTNWIRRSIASICVILWIHDDDHWDAQAYIHHSFIHDMLACWMRDITKHDWLCTARGRACADVLHNGAGSVKN